MEESEQSDTRAAIAAVIAGRPHNAATPVEYAFILSLISALVFGSLTLVGSSLNDVFVAVGTTLASVVPNNGNNGGNGNNP